jgi:hypothetical protein
MKKLLLLSIIFFTIKSALMDLPLLQQSMVNQPKNFQEMDFKLSIPYLNEGDLKKIDPDLKRSGSNINTFPIPEVAKDIFLKALKPSDLNANVNTGNAMYTITSPGRYFFTGNILLAPENDDVTGIRISSDNVVLDFSSFSISQVQTTTANSVTAVEIDSNLSNIAIIFGGIDNINGTGIKANDDTINILISNMVINKCSLFGTYITNCKNIILNSSVITNCTGEHYNATDGAVGLKLDNIKNIRAISCFFNKQSSTTKDACGILMSNCQACRMQDCAGSGMEGVNAYSFKITNTCRSCLFRDCDCAGNVSSAGVAIGMSLAYSQGITVLGNYSGSHSSTGSDCYGFEVNSCEAIDFLGCMTKDNKATTTGSVAGFHCTLSNICRFINCHSIYQNSSSNAYGFYLFGCQSNVFKECEARGQDASGGTGDAYGFYTSSGAGNGYDTCRSASNKGGSGLTSISAGFAIRGGEDYSAIQKCISSGNNAVGEAYGIMLGYTSENPNIRCIIHDNKLINNLAGIKKYGFRDFAENSTALLSANVSFGHGKINPSTTEQLTLTNSMNFMFTYTTAQYPGYVVGEKKIGEVATITNSGPYANLSLIEYL